MVSFSLMVRRWSSATSEDEAEASGSSVSEQVKSRLKLKAVVFNFKQLDLDPPTTAAPIRLFLWGGVPPLSFGTYQIYCVIFHVPNNKSLILM